MTKQEYITEISKIVITTLHGCGWESALEKELGFGCVLSNWEGEHRVISDSFMVSEWGRVSPLEDSSYEREYSENFGRPITLSRLMTAMIKKNSGNFYVSWQDRKSVRICCQFWEKDETIFNWQLLREDKSPADLNDQTVETLKAIYQLFKGDNQ